MMRPFQHKSTKILLVLTCLLMSLVTSLAFSSVNAKAMARPQSRQKVLLRLIVQKRSVHTKLVPFSPHVVPNGGGVQRCLTDTAAITPASASNEASAFGETLNQCGFFVGGRQTVNINASCAGGISASPFTGQEDFGRADETAFDAPFTVNAGCVVCVDGVPTDFPPITLNINVFSSGSGRSGSTVFSVNSNTGQDSTEVTNDGAFAPPCS